MIVKDESYFLPRCLAQSAEYVDEIIVVDTGSTDDTLDIARRYTDKCFSFNWIDDFAAARNHGLEKASGDWIVVLDADEVIEPEHWQQIRAVISSTEMDAFFLTERNYSYTPFEGNWVPIEKKTQYTRDFLGYKPHYIARLFRNLPTIRYQGHVHEIIDNSLQEDRYEILDIAIHHHGAESPDRPPRERQMGYLRLMEQDLASDSSGRLFGTAASIRMHYLKDYAKAIEYYDRAIELGWQVEESSESRATALYLRGDLEGAYFAYKALHDEGYRSVNLCINLANLAVKREEHGFAAELLERAISIGIKDPKIRMKLDHNIRYLREQTLQS